MVKARSSYNADENDSDDSGEEEGEEGGVDGDNDGTEDDDEVPRGEFWTIKEGAAAAYDEAAGRHGFLTNHPLPVSPPVRCVCVVARCG